MYAHTDTYAKCQQQIQFQLYKMNEERSKQNKNCNNIK